jgi:hypothetical protein
VSDQWDIGCLSWGMNMLCGEMFIGGMQMGSAGRWSWLVLDRFGQVCGVAVGYKWIGMRRIEGIFFALAKRR